MSFAVKDATLIQTAALPNGATTTVITGFDLGHDPTKIGRLLAEMEILIESPALTVGELPNGETITFSVETDDNSGFSSALKIYDALFVQTGAGGVGDVAKSARFRLPSTVERFVRVKATKTGAGNASTKSMTVSQLF